MCAGPDGCRPYVSTVTLDEIREVLNRPEIRKSFSKKLTDESVLDFLDHLVDNGMVHLLRIEKSDDLDADLVGWLQDAYDYRKQKDEMKETP
jgi:predicted nucleic acid-binding protein